MSELLFHLLLGAVDLLGLALIARRPGRRSLLIVLGLGVIAVIVLSAFFGGGSFSTLRLLAWGIFGHGLLGLIAAAVVMWKKRRKCAIAAAATAGFIALIAIDAFLIEPRWLEVSRHQLTSAEISEPVRIVVVADFQAEEIGAHERRALTAARDAEPDLLLFLGDYVQVESDERRAELRGELRVLLEELSFQPRLGAIAVRGNVDRDGWEESFPEPFVTVHDRQRFTWGPVTVTALSLFESLRGQTRVDDAPGLHVTCGHLPNFATGKVEADLLLAGHVHGGQVRLPFIGPLLTASTVPRSWAVGRTELPEGRTLLVSRGIGMERLGAPPLRFLCRPEVVVIDVVPGASAQQG
ncbi:MAG: metallophosphoesterase [Acidobacteriota bacterium]